MSLSVYYQRDDEIFEQFDNYEIWPCISLGTDESGSLVYESCDIDDKNIAIWSVYGHFQTGGLDCISDLLTLDDAKEFMNTLPAMPLKPLVPS